MKTPLLIFDLMDTVVVDPFLHVFPNYFGLTTTELWLIKDLDSWPAFELGEIDEADYFRCFFRPDCDRTVEDPEGFKKALFSSYCFIEGMEALLTELQTAGVPMWVHSNYTHWIEEVRTRLNLDRFFQGYAISYKLKARKPDQAAYQAALNLIGARAEDCLFIDDRESNVLAAYEVGLRGITFENTNKLRRELADYGFKV